MDVGEEVLKQLVEVLANQEQAWSTEASNLQVQAHQTSGKAAACKVIGEAVLKLVKEVEDQVEKATIEAAKPTEMELEVERRKGAGVCIYKEHRGEWCPNKGTAKTHYCRKHNKELGI